MVGGRKKSSTLYGLGSQERVAYDRVITPRARGRPSGSSSTIEALQKENQELKNRFSALEAQQHSHDHLAQQMATQQHSHDQLAQQMATFTEAFGQTPTMPTYDAMRAMRGANLDTETQDPNSPDQYVVACKDLLFWLGSFRYNSNMLLYFDI